MGITYTKEDAIVAGGEMLHIFYAHGQEVIGDEYNFAWPTFYTVAMSGRARMFVVRKNGKPIGYAFFVVDVNPFNAKDIVANCMAIYVMPEFRGRISTKLITFFEMQLFAEGITSIRTNSPTNSRLNRIWEKLGYTPYETSYRKHAKWA